MSLITSIAEIKKYIAIDDNSKMETLQPYIDEAEQLYIVGLLGKAFYNDFATKYAGSVAESSPVPLSADNAKLLPYIQRSLAYYTLLLSIPHLSVTIGEMGVRNHRDSESDVAPRWQIEKIQLNALKNGDIHADRLLAFLEENATASNDYQIWFASTANTRMSGRIVYSTAIASKHIAISESRRVFLQLMSTIDQLESRVVPKLIGQDQYDELVQQLKTQASGIPTPANTKLIALLEPIISKRALFIRLPFMRISIAQDGIWLYSDVTEIRSKDFLAAKEEVKELRCQLMDGELGYLADEQLLQQFIIENIDDYPEIKASTVYTVKPDPGPTFVPENSACNKHFIG